MCVKSKWVTMCAANSVCYIDSTQSNLLVVVIVLGCFVREDSNSFVLSSSNPVSIPGGRDLSKTQM